MNKFCELSAEKQKEVKTQVCEMLANGLGYKRIRKKLQEQDLSLSMGALSYWCNTETKRLRKNSFISTPSKELSYFVGVMFGDGCATKDQKNHDYCLMLGTIDKDFAQHFSFCVTKLLNKTKEYPVHSGKNNMHWVNIRSKELHQFVKEIKTDFKKAKPFIEKFPADFIQGLADSEGCPAISANNNFRVEVYVANSANLELLKYTQYLLSKYFDITSTTRLTKKAGIIDSVIEGRKITRTKNLYLNAISSLEDVKKYFLGIKFSIKRKQEKLKDGIAIIENYKSEERYLEWQKKYVKNKKQWIKISCPTNCEFTPKPGFEPGSHPNSSKESFANLLYLALASVVLSRALARL